MDQVQPADVKYLDCIEPLVDCFKPCRANYTEFMKTWPPPESKDHITFTSPELATCLVSCGTDASINTGKVMEDSKLNSTEFKKYGLVSLCTKTLVVCSQTCLNTYNKAVMSFDKDHSRL
ncbi:hypothetical protein PtrSN002B_004399 [Pyrenophora tritici-repentis]|uniref:Uncharacterized protein n=2 Tax=Pyrenophora tritici-repentis TaxID=45151 RepID=A0A2W1FC07_9PLEO|nr:uncharacterized protein PTRG_04074 [Pyrenophora tritici-repentis Pt-1C-BFP]KAA8619839.1 hypothetical protein PtrV1_06933 [Pyrenophora tritici-repentis]EDU46912.1 hypothetical protein PTRG_04074 [Pyrenophora tritici-repentis Pt-1C-BFP]KAF7571686.1 hypothetical protein PtrM4_091860 [Pyrenophora tritici-repentis]KAG9385097.1 hypothetical protein A1F94_004644 [Pyrenophora tritici-repentis]KAI0579077.1 hypothetical protein Alg130_07656 [Pyrenophora tritici-repentis]